MEDEDDPSPGPKKSQDEGSFNPKLYTFRFPAQVRPNQTYSVLAPPFWVLVDHLIAVVWHLYTSETAQKVGVVHLQWAGEFIKWIKDENGDAPTAIQSLILVIEDALMEKYSNLSKIRSAKDQSERTKEDTTQETITNSVTLNDILARNAFVEDQVTNKCGKKMVLSKASGTLQDPSKQSDSQEPGENEVISFLNYLKKRQEDKIKRESNFLAEIENALSEVNSNKRADFSKLIEKLEGRE